MSKTDVTENEGGADLVRIYIWVALLVSVALGGVLWWMNGRLEKSQKTLVAAKRKLPQFAKDKVRIEQMLNVFSNNKEEDARRRPNTWFPAIWSKKGLPDASVRLGAWSEKYVPRDNYDEHQIEFKFDAKNPLSRRQIVSLAHEIERASTRLRVLEMKLGRAKSSRTEEFKPNDWTGKLTVGYRVARIRE